MRLVKQIKSYEETMDLRMLLVSYTITFDSKWSTASLKASMYFLLIFKEFLQSWVCYSKCVRMKFAQSKDET